jgi:Tfp pilus assembly protein PilF
MHLSTGDLGVALLLLERAEQAGTRRGTVKNLLGLTYYQLAEPQEAAEAFKEAVAADPGDPHLHLNYAAHCASFGQIDKAKAEAARSGGLIGQPRGPTDHPDVAMLGQFATAAPKGGKPGR